MFPANLEAGLVFWIADEVHDHAFDEAMSRALALAHGRRMNDLGRTLPSEQGAKPLILIAGAPVP